MAPDAQRKFIPLTFAVLTVSDTRTLAEDRSGDVLVQRLTAAGHSLADRSLCVDDTEQITLRLREWINNPTIDVVLTTGGTGITGRDVTPEAVRAVLTKELPGFGELFRMLSYKTIGTNAMQSRALGGVAGSTYVFALPGSPSAVAEAWDGILAEQFDTRNPYCSLAELRPRLSE